MTKFNHVISFVWASLQTFETRKKEEGITAIEYALMAAGMAVIIAAVLLILKGKLTELFTNIPDPNAVPAT